MPGHIVYAYVDGSELHEVAAHIETRLETFIREHPWSCGAPTLVNQQHAPDPDAHPEDLHDWDLGVNLVVPTNAGRTEDFLDDLESLTVFLGRLYRETTRDFVIGLADSETGDGEDCLSVGERVPDRTKLRLLL